MEATADDLQFFVDPGDLLGEILRDGGEDGLNVLISGAPGAGKTSLLAAARHHLLRDESLLVASVNGRRADGVLQLLDAVSYDMERARERAGIGDTLTKRTVEWLLSSSAQEEPKAVDQALAALQRGIPENRRGVVLLDEIRADIGHALFGRLRDELWGLRLNWIVTASPSEMSALLTPPADSFFERIVEIPAFDQVTADRFLNLRVAARPSGDAAIRQSWGRLIDMAEGNPLRLLTLARHVAAGEKLGRIQRDREEVERTLETVSPAARRLYRLLDQWGAGSAADDNLQNHLGVTPARLTQLFKELQRQGLVMPSIQPGPQGGKPRTVYARSRSVRKDGVER